ncbi:MAG: hydrolase, partial [Pseudaminobacter sp.]
AGMGRNRIFEDKPFLRATTRSVMYVPVNMGRVFSRVLKHIEEAGAADDEHAIVLSRDTSHGAASIFSRFRGRFRTGR